MSINVTINYVKFAMKKKKLIYLKLQAKNQNVVIFEFQKTIKMLLLKN